MELEGQCMRCGCTFRGDHDGCPVCDRERRNRVILPPDTEEGRRLWAELYGVKAGTGK